MEDALLPRPDNREGRCTAVHGSRTELCESRFEQIPRCGKRRHRLHGRWLLMKRKDVSVRFKAGDYVIPGLLAVLLLVSLFQAYQISTLESTLSRGASGYDVDMSGWTEDERMMYEHHGTLPARLQGAPSGNGGGMVGGC